MNKYHHISAMVHDLGVVRLTVWGTVRDVIKLIEFECTKPPHCSGGYSKSDDQFLTLTSVEQWL
ncbi:hypothetical protein [Vibrio gazogenes]|uniref:Uncharacterized protein n=1 Tax=Vibrio gazogenes DSM 21264 = NBRC 103151 TaxID=1123492 RepID=A0A1M5FXV7_VIBGA|nr:hypothetical protein [Vibrio gazogenes]USP14690.1 hypothetical protein MKS89_05075 [Vibrio gazogenes]SHF96293.1 hypothetical protein SAMN02745781_03613 [Vibrio gazogenes DSM 21264] [Vibrio gazogenes DSM 21264 = NBRC 103151]SJN52946.1 hypothetical protein BQ6471_00167 [Vibrio gazogenes]